MKFRTQFERIKVTSCVGEMMQPEYKLHYTEDGAQDLVQVGQKNLYQEIQSWRDSCDIQVILARYNAGDPTALNARIPLFGDFTGLPDSTAGFLQMLNDAEDAFSKLPLEQRAAFDHSPHKYFASIGKPEFFEKMGIKPEAPAVVPEVPAVVSEVPAVVPEVPAVVASEGGAVSES